MLVAIRDAFFVEQSSQSLHSRFSTESVLQGSGELHEEVMDRAFGTDYVFCLTAVGYSYNAIAISTHMVLFLKSGSGSE